MSTGNIVTLVLAGLALAGTLVTGYMTRKSSKEANQLNGWAALTGGLQAEVAACRQRLDDLEKKVEHERKARHTLVEVVRSAWSHILRLGDQVRTLGGDPEPAPRDLAAFMRSDGLIVDSVETTIRRTTVTDTRDPDAEPVEQVTYEVHRNTDPD